MSATLLQENSDLVAILRTYNDVTERLKKSHETLWVEVARLRRELEEKDRALQRSERLAALGEMAAGVAHEIRNPLGGIGLYASLLERDLTDTPGQLQIARRISAGVQSLEVIVRDILSFAGDAAPRMADVRLGDVLDNVLIQAAPQVDARSITLEVDPALHAIELHCDATQIERALMNLVFNALDAVGESGRVWVRKGATSGGAELAAIAVDDDGPGIEPACLQKIFNPFFTTKDHGTGLGLAIVHRIAEAHGGSITARNRTPRGASFTIFLPVTDTGSKLPVAHGGMSRDLSGGRIVANSAANCQFSISDGQLKCRDER